jgi:hypothetical protein
MRLFRHVGGEFRADLDAEEGAVIAMVVAMARAIIDGEAPPELDTLPTLNRVFPPGSATDAEVARDFAALTGQGMRTRKSERLGRLGAYVAQGRIRLDQDQAADAVAALGDVRLVVAEILGIETAEDADRVTVPGPDEPTDMQQLFGELYVALSVLQESLVKALME